MVTDAAVAAVVVVADAAVAVVGNVSTILTFI